MAHEPSPARRSAFTIIELLAVVSIIAILMGMIGAAAYTARQKGYRAQAATEVHELANACRAYWIAFGKWPGSSGAVTREVYRALTGINDTGTVFLQFDETRFTEGDDGAFLDPWGHAYELKFDSPDANENTIQHHFHSSVTFPMRNRREFYGHLFEN